MNIFEEKLNNMSLFQVLDAVFGTDEEMARISDKNLKACAFNVQRIMSIRYPTMANEMNFVGTNPSDIVKAWHHSIKHQYNATPPWSRVATARARKEYLSKRGKEVKMPDKKLVDQYMNFKDMDNKELEFLIKHNPKELIKEIKELDKALKS